MERTTGGLTPGLRVAAIAITSSNGRAHLVAMLFVLRVAKTIGAKDARWIGPAISTTKRRENVFLVQQYTLLDGQ